MAKKKSFDEIMSLFKQRYGDKFDYCGLNKDNYINSSTKIPIICPLHGLFYLSPARHISYPCGCPMCGRNQSMVNNTAKQKPRKLLFGVGINDDTEIHSKKYESMAYRKWRTMLARCYSSRYQAMQGTYKDCRVCDEWLIFSNFKKWHDEHYKDGYELDKDILFKGNKVYSPNTCCYIPKFINTILLSCKKVRGVLPVGVVKHGDRYVAQMSTYSQKSRYGYIGTFDTIDDAFQAYKQAKENHIKQIAQQYFDDGKITEKVYNALMNYHIEITD